MERKIEKAIERSIKKIRRHNEKLAEYVRVTGDNQLPTIDCTVIGFEEVNPITWQETEQGIVVDDNGYTIRMEQEYEDGEYWLSGVDDLEMSLRYDARQLKKAWRVWRAENPDAELEKEDED